MASCIEEFEPETITFENILVVEATLTDEFGRQEIVLSRTTPIENQANRPEENARIAIVEGSQNEFLFEEVAPGNYLSLQSFAAIENESYQLQIETSDGKIYKSKQENMPSTANIDMLSVSRKVNENGTDGVEISVDGSSDNNETTYFRYEYEETYQIISPFNPSTDLFVISENPPLVEERLREKQDRVCYNTTSSNSIMIATTQGLIESEITNFPIRFIASDDIILRNRYSINVKQFTQTRQAHAFYENLQEFSDLESVFAQTQAGFIQGNIEALENPNEKVLGYFEVSSVRSQRVFFDFRDVFPDINFPAFVADCGSDAIEGGFLLNDQELVNLLNSGNFRFVTFEFGAYYLAPAECVDCTLLGTNIEPEFWEE
ncbi:DUF4249 domain-containing protein [Allomuricauda sp. d1]|uniref:DUF4249 domain-containing protein n=1 Tax=Allomuricauda sp. d1 TaxID=3136725 RepID=UPI0031DA83CE